MKSPGALIVVDVQRGFMNEHTDHIRAHIERLQAQFPVIVATRYYRRPDSAMNRLLSIEGFERGSPETELAFTPRADAIVCEKSEYSCVGHDLVATLRDRGVESAAVCGVDTDQCVLITAADLLQSDIVPIVLEDASASAAGPQYHDAGLLLLRRLIGNEQVRHSAHLHPTQR